ncbi:hypothetical protein C8P67_1285 [Flavobacterium aquicola]|uniref:Uncharacterized protein n=2 Tax=Flavobacterium aquicola TaxID=1682742 RepID=A0A3E0DWA1_9FLAO|nr:hypothetical protein C8P67_1285 [Flavobacterium aquicola]
MLKIVLLLLSFNLFAQTEADYEIVQIEGFYTYGWENSSFYEAVKDNLNVPMWLEFDKNLTLPDSLRKVIFDDNFDGVFMKIIGKKNNNGNFGHLGASTSMITVTKIIFVDPKKTLKNNFVKKKLK